MLLKTDILDSNSIITVSYVLKFCNPFGWNYCTVIEYSLRLSYNFRLHTCVKFKSVCFHILVGK